MTRFCDEFRRALSDRGSDPSDRRWLFVAYDQLSDVIGPLAEEEPAELGIVVVESRAKGRRRPYHRQKLALVLANLRHFALEQAARGVAVRHVVTAGTYHDALAPVTRELGPLRMLTPAERELTRELAPLVDAEAIELLPHPGWLTTRDDFERSQSGPPWRLDRFYRHVRRMTGILMEDGRPAGGKYSFDSENRKRWTGSPAAPEPLEFEPDAITNEVLELVEESFPDHPGALLPRELPATHLDAERLWSWAKRECLPDFGPYQDAMAVDSHTLFHSRIAPLLHLHRLLPRRVVDDVARLELPIASQEGFIRQVLGWREFVRHVHVATDGFRSLPEGEAETASRPGTAGIERWSGHPFEAVETSGLDGGSTSSFLGTDRPLPPAFWGAPSGLACLDRVVDDVWNRAYGHHITRLMILSNIAALLDLSPRELTDWFWCAYTDAFDWVVEPNVLGMGTYAVGDLMTTKPYVAGSNYIHRMSDYCDECAFHPKRDCPLGRLYWAFLARHADRLADNPRLALPLRSVKKRSVAERREDAESFDLVSQRLERGDRVGPDPDPESRA